MKFAWNCLFVLAGAAFACPAVALADPADRAELEAPDVGVSDWIIPEPEARVLKEAARPYSVIYNVERAAVRAVVAPPPPPPPPDVPADPFLKATRIGSLIDVPVTRDDGEWTEIPGVGWLWTVDVVSEGALGVRLHLVDLMLSEGSGLVVFNPDAVGEPIVHGPIRGRGDFEDGEMWTPTVEGQVVRVELLWASEKPPAPGVHPFRIDRLGHIDGDLLFAEFAGERTSDPPTTEGVCHNDVTCFAAWANQAKAVARVAFVDPASGVISLCSGTLLATGNGTTTVLNGGDRTPYFLTANHCISVDEHARSAEFFWNYQRPQCDGGDLPKLASLRRSFGATLVATSAATDFTLLLVEGALPRDEVTWAGWDANAVANGVNTAGIHHPRGSFKRISFGTTANSATIPVGNFVQINWNRDPDGAGPRSPGVVEQASSGSGIFRDDANKRLVGQLRGGPSACGGASLWDDYGRFSETYSRYAAVRTALGGGSDDELEQNDTCAAAVVLANGSYLNLVVKSTDEDWYKINVPNGQTLHVTAMFKHAWGDIDISLVTTCGGATVASSVGSTDIERLSWTNNTGAAVNAILRVYLACVGGNCDTRNQYALTTGFAPANDTCESAILVGNGTTLFNTVGAATDGAPENTCLFFGDNQIHKDVFYRYVATGNGNVTVSLCGSSFDTKLAVYDTQSCNPLANIVGCNDDSCGLQSQLTFAAVSNRNYYIRVGGFNGASGAGSMTITGPQNPINDLCANAAFITIPGVYDGTLVNAGTEGTTNCGGGGFHDVFYRLVAPCSGTMVVTTCPLPNPALDTVVSVHSGCPAAAANTLACNDQGPGACSPGSTLSLAVTQGTTYYIRVASKNDTTDTFRLTVGITQPNNVCAGAVPVNLGVQTFLTGCGTDPGSGSPGCGGRRFADDVWFRFISPCTGPLTFDTCGSSFDTMMAIYTAATCPADSAAPTQCNDDDARCGVQSRIRMNVTSGTRYYIRIGAVNGDQGGDITGPGRLRIRVEGDLDGNGTVGVGDVAVLINNWNALIPPGDDPDLDGNGVIGVGDVAVLILNWGTGCT